MQGCPGGSTGDCFKIVTAKTAEKAEKVAAAKVKNDEHSAQATGSIGT